MELNTKYGEIKIYAKTFEDKAPFVYKDSTEIMELIEPTAKSLTI